MTASPGLIDECREAFTSYFGERGWRMERYDNPSGYIEYMNKDTNQLWLGWNSAWKIQAEKLEACIQEMQGGCPV